MGSTASCAAESAADELREVIVRRGNGPGDHVHQLDCNGFKAQVAVLLEAQYVYVSVFSVDDRWSRHAVTFEVQLRDTDNRVVVEDVTHTTVRAALQSTRAVAVSYDPDVGRRLVDGHLMQLKVAITPNEGSPLLDIDTTRPAMPPLSASLPPEARIVTELDDDRVACAPVIIWFFGSSDSDKSEAFRRRLSDMYTQLNVDPHNKTVEVIYIGCDPDELSFTRTVSGSPWLALAYDGEYSSLLKEQELKGRSIPHALVQDDDGETLCGDGVAEITSVLRTGGVHAAFDLVKQWLPHFEMPKAAAALQRKASPPAKATPADADLSSSLLARRLSFAPYDISGTIEGADGGNRTFTYSYSEEGMELTLTLNLKAHTVEVMTSDIAVRWDTHTIACTLRLSAGRAGVPITIAHRQDTVEVLKKEGVMTFTYGAQHSAAVADRHQVFFAFRAAPPHAYESNTRDYAIALAEQPRVTHDWVLFGDSATLAHDISISSAPDCAAGVKDIPTLTLHAGFALTAEVSLKLARVAVSVKDIDPRWHSHALALTFFFSALDQVSDTQCPPTPSETELVSEGPCDKWVLLGRESRRFDTVVDFLTCGFIGTPYPHYRERLVQRRYCLRITAELWNDQQLHDPIAGSVSRRLCRFGSHPSPVVQTDRVADLGTDATDLGGTDVGDEGYPAGLLLPPYVVQRPFCVDMCGRLTGRGVLRERRVASEIALLRRVGEHGRETTLSATTRGNLAASLLLARTPPPPHPAYRPSEEEKARLRELFVTAGDVGGTGTGTTEARWIAACNLLSRIISTAPHATAAAVYAAPESLASRLAVAVALACCSDADINAHDSGDAIERFNFFMAAAGGDDDATSDSDAGASFHPAFADASVDLLRYVVASHIRIPDEAVWVQNHIPHCAPEHFAGERPRPVGDIASCLLKRPCTAPSKPPAPAGLEAVLANGCTGWEEFSWFGAGVAHAFGVPAVRVADPAGGFFTYENDSWELKGEGPARARGAAVQEAGAAAPWGDEVGSGGVAWRIAGMTRCQGRAKGSAEGHVASRAGYVESEHLRTAAALVMEGVAPINLTAGEGILARVTTPTPLRSGGIDGVVGLSTSSASTRNGPSTPPPAPGCVAIADCLEIRITLHAPHALVRVRVRHSANTTPCTLSLAGEADAGAPRTLRLSGQPMHVLDGSMWATYDAPDAGAVRSPAGKLWTLTLRGAAGAAVAVKSIEVYGVKDAVVHDERTRHQAGYAASLLRAAVAKCPWNYPAWRDLADVASLYMQGLCGHDGGEGQLPAAGWVASAYRGYQHYATDECVFDVEMVPSPMVAAANGHSIDIASPRSCASPRATEVVGQRAVGPLDAEVTASSTAEGSATPLAVLGCEAGPWLCSERDAQLTVALKEPWQVRRVALQWAGPCKAARFRFAVASVANQTVGSADAAEDVNADGALAWQVIASEADCVGAVYNPPNGEDGEYRFSFSFSQVALGRVTHVRFDMFDGVQDAAMAGAHGAPPPCLALRHVRIEGVPMVFQRPLRPTLEDMSWYLVSRAFSAMQHQARQESLELTMDCANMRGAVEACFAPLVPYFAQHTLPRKI